MLTIEAVREELKSFETRHYSEQELELKPSRAIAVREHPTCFIECAANALEALNTNPPNYGPAIAIFDEWLQVRRENLRRAGLGDWAPSPDEVERPIGAMDVFHASSPEREKLDYCRVLRLRQVLPAE